MTLHNEVKNGLKEYLAHNSVYSPLLKAYESGDIFPYITFEKSNDIEDSTDLQRFNVVDSIEFEINIFAKAKVSGTKTIANKTIATEIEEHIKEYFRRLGFKRTFDKPTPNLDKTIYRITMRYKVKVNTQRKYFI